MSAAAVNGGVAGDAASKPGAAMSSAKQPQSQAQLKASSINGKTLDGARKQASPQPDAQNKKPQQKAWQGAHPFMQRNANGSPNGPERAAARPPPPTAPANRNTSSAHADRHAHDRTTFLFVHMIGRDATLKLRTGEIFTGVFSGYAQEANSSQYRLKMVRREQDAQSELIGEGEDHVMAFDVQDTIELVVPDVTTSSGPTQQNGARSSFRTDTQISATDTSRTGHRELQRWQPGPESAVDMSLEASGESGWDQFAANEKLYGVQSTYDEDIYTTTINRNDPKYKRLQAEAERIAREIEGSAPANAHVAEERRRDANKDDGEDEEDKYSGVRREANPLPKRAAGAYVPPSQRAISAVPTVPGAPFDPAIISSQISKPSSQAHVPIPTIIPPPERSQAASTEPTGAKATPPPLVSSASGGPPEQPLDRPSTHAAGALVKDKQPTPDDHARGAADAFHQFANTERFRIRQAQEAKRSLGRTEKNVKLNDLKKFAANFKLKSRVPDDLVPILAKDREKQLEIQNKAEEAAKEEEQRAREKEHEKTTPPAAPIAAAAPSQPPVSGDARALNNQNQRARGSQQGRGGAAVANQQPTPRAPLSSRIQGNYQQYQQQNAQARPSGDARNPSVAESSTSSSTRLNVNAKAFEFRPGASSFSPSGTSPSPQRVQSRPAPVAGPFFDDAAKKATCETISYDAIERLSKADYADHQKKQFAANGGFPQSYTTPPTWATVKANDAISYLSAFAKPSAPGTPMHGGAQMPLNVAHGMPMHMSSPAGRQQFYPPQQMGYNPMQPQFGGPVQNSPRQQPIAMAPFNGQMAGMPYPNQPMPGYGMSPSMPYRQLQQPGGPMMMMPGQPQGQMPGPMRGSFSQPGFAGPHMMVQQASSGGYGQAPPPGQGPNFSPMPPHAQPHMPHLQHPGSNGFNGGSPRPPMMAHQGSHQGYPGGMGMPQQGYGSPAPPHVYHMNQRAMSNGYPPPVMGTPRTHHVQPFNHHQSPGGPGAANSGNATGPAVAGGDDGK